MPCAAANVCKVRLQSDFLSGCCFTHSRSWRVAPSRPCGGVQERLDALREKARLEDLHDSTLSGSSLNAEKSAQQLEDEQHKHLEAFLDGLKKLKAATGSSGEGLPGLAGIDDILKDPRKKSVPLTSACFAVPQGSQFVCTCIFCHVGCCRKTLCPLWSPELPVTVMSGSGRHHGHFFWVIERPDDKACFGTSPRSPQHASSPGNVLVGSTRELDCQTSLHGDHDLMCPVGQHCEIGQNVGTMKYCVPAYVYDQPTLADTSRHYGWQGS
jgi:hypothetical protein